MKRLIVNADDFGFTRGVNDGIVRAFKEGILTSATVMANGDAFEHAIALARANPGLGIGCHLSIVDGRPLTPPEEVPSLVGDDGRLPATLSQLVLKLMRGKIRSADIEREFRTQIERVLSTGISLTHVDSHKHSHTLPPVMSALARAARAFGIRCVRNPFERVFARAPAGAVNRLNWRAYLKQYAMSAAVAPLCPAFRRRARQNGLRSPDHFCGVRLTGLWGVEAMSSAIRGVEEGVTELMCHPGISDDELEHERTRLKQERSRELEILIDPALRRSIDERAIKLISYSELA